MATLTYNKGYTNPYMYKPPTTKNAGSSNVNGVNSPSNGSQAVLVPCCHVV